MGCQVAVWLVRAGFLLAAYLRLEYLGLRPADRTA